MKLAVIASARSGSNRRNPGRLAELKELAEAGGALFASPSTLDELASVSREFAKRAEVLAVNGGDGTLHRVVTAIATADESFPTLAVLPGGTMNIVANSTGWWGAPHVGLRKILAGEGVRTQRSLLKIDEQLYGFLWGNGLIARFLEVYEEGDPTVLRAAAILGRGAASSLIGGPFVKRLTRRWEGEVEVDGSLLTGTSWLTVAAGTVEQIGLGFRPFRLADPNHMHLVGLGSSAARFAFELPHVYRRRPLRAPENVERAATEVWLRGTEPSTFMVDGDFHRGPRELRVGLGPVVEFLVPGANC